MVFATPDIVKQAVAGSHISVWRQPAFSQGGMLLFTILVGTFGLHHVMLRSPLTALLFIALNTTTWGYWWMFDIFQLAFDDVEDLNTYGLGSPFLFEFGVAVGMWNVDTKVATKDTSLPVTPFAASPSPSPSPSANATANAKANATANAKANAKGNPTETVAVRSNDPAPPEAAAAAPTEAAPTPAAAAAPKGGYRQRGGASAAPAPPSPPTPSGLPPNPGLAERFGNFMQRLLSMMLSIFNPRPPERPFAVDESKVIRNPFSHSLWIFLFILCAPIGVISSAIAGDNTSALLHILDPLMILTFFLNAVDILFNPLEIFMGGVYRPLLYRALNTPFEVRGQSNFLQRATLIPVDEIGNVIKMLTDVFKEGAGAFEKLANFVPAAGVAGLAEAGKDAAAAAVQTAQAAAGAANASIRKIDAEATLLEAQAEKLRGTQPAAVNLSKGLTDSANAAEAAAAAAANKNPTPSSAPKGGFVQRGGGKSSERSESSFDTLSLGTLGAVLVGGLLLGVSRSNVFQGKDDSPPVARRVRGA